MTNKISPVLETERLILRPLTVDDAESAFVWQSDERVNRFMPYDLYKSVEETRRWITETLPNEEDYAWGFELKENGLLIDSGSIGSTGSAEGWSFGYNIRYDYWNKGLTTEAAKRMIKFAYDEMGIKVFTSDHAIQNPPSVKVIEKCGLTFDHMGEYSTFDGNKTFQAKYYRMQLD